jgi:phosphohistidine phosphatase
VIVVGSHVHLVFLRRWSLRAPLHPDEHSVTPILLRVRIYLCRHAQAVSGDPDESRELSAQGQAQAQALGEAIAARAEPPRVVLSSPLLRAQQTAAAIGLATGAPVRVEAALAPGATIAELTEALEGERGPVATVGHQPDCSEILIALTGDDPGFPVAGMVELELEIGA